MFTFNTPAQTPARPAAPPTAPTTPVAQTPKDPMSAPDARKVSSGLKRIGVDVPTYDALSKALGGMYRAMPFHASVLLELDLLEADASSGIDTAATDCVTKVMLNRAFMEQLTPEMAMFVLGHEVEHVIRQHGTRLSQLNVELMDADGTVRVSPQLWNLAADFFINGDLSEEGHHVTQLASHLGLNTMTVDEFVDNLRLMAAGKPPKSQGGFCYDSRVTSRGGPYKTTEDLYKYFLDQWNEAGGGSVQKVLSAGDVKPGESQDGGTGEGKDDGTGGGTGEGQGEGQGKGQGTPSISDGSDASRELLDQTSRETGMTEQELNQQSNTNVAAAAQSAKSRGTLPGRFDGLIEDLLAPKVDWAAALRRFMFGHFDRRDFSYRRLSRRTSMYGTADGDDVMLVHPSLFSETPGTFVCIVDESGSVSDKELQAFLSEMNYILNRVKPRDIYMITCDTRVTGVRKFTPGDTLNIQTKGRGGTDMGPAFKEIKRRNLRPAAIMCFTDGYMPWPEKPNCPTLFAISGDRQSYEMVKANYHEWGEIINVDTSND